MYKSFLLLTIISISACYQKSSSKYFSEHGADGIITQGQLMCDSLYHGKINYYDTVGIHLGYSIYYYGLKNGCEVSYYPDGNVRDSSFYQNGLRNGFAYNFETTGKLAFKGYYLNGRRFGPAYGFDENGTVNQFAFTNFEGKFVFQSEIEHSAIYNSGDEIQAFVYQKALTSGKANDVLLLYLILSPFVRSHYELAILNDKREFISSKRIESEHYYYEQDLPDLPEGYRYAVVLHTYNASKGRDDLSVRVIE